MNGIIRDMKDMREKMNKKFLLRDISFVQMYYVIGLQCRIQV